MGGENLIDAEDQARPHDHICFVVDPPAPLDGVCGYRRDAVGEADLAQLVRVEVAG